MEEFLKLINEFRSIEGGNYSSPHGEEDDTEDLKKQIVSTYHQIPNEQKATAIIKATLSLSEPSRSYHYNGGILLPNVHKIISMLDDAA